MSALAERANPLAACARPQETHVRLTPCSISDEQRAEAAAAKDRGNAAFRAGKHAEAEQLYTEAIGE